MCKRKFAALVCASLCLMAVAEGRISLFHVYDWSESSTGVVTVKAADPFYFGGWTVDLRPDDSGALLTSMGGITMHDVAQPIVVDYRNGKALLSATGDEPFATVSGSRVIEAGGVTTTVDSVMSYYVVNEEWVTGGELSDIEGELLEDGSIHFAGGFAYYIETVKTTTITSRDGSARTFTDETADVSRIFRDLWLLTPNGKHEFTSEDTGETRSVDVHISQSGDTVMVVNLYGYGAPAAMMLLGEDGSMAYPAQMLRDIPDVESPGGMGLWYNASVNGASVTPGNAGLVTTEAITWGLTRPWDRARTWQGWDNNRLYYTDGTEFDLPGSEQWQLGDVNHDGKVDVSDVTALIAYILGNEPDAFFTEQANVNLDAEGKIDVSDVTALIALILGN